MPLCVALAVISHRILRAKLLPIQRLGSHAASCEVTDNSQTDLARDGVLCGLGLHHL